jgi:two-component system sensor histidine kinase PilS (NtrC family)
MAILARPRSIRFVQLLRLALLVFVAATGILLFRDSYPGIAIFVVDIPLVALAVAYALSWIWLRQTEHEDGSLDELPLIAQIVLDVLLMALVVFYTGASSSTLLLVFLLPTILAGAFLYLRGTLIAASLSVAFLLGLFYLDASGMLSAYNVGREIAPDLLGSGIFQRYYTQPVGLDDIGAFDLLIRFLTVSLVLFAAAFTSGYLAERVRFTVGEMGELTRRLDRIRLNTSDVLANLESGLVTVDKDGLIIFFNRAAREILGLDGPEPEGRNYEIALSGRLSPLARLIASALEGVRPNRRNEIWIDDPDDGRTPLGVTPSILHGEQGIRGVVLVFQDITEAKLLEQKIRRQDRLAAIGELAAGIAHELRNPLASISGSAEVLNESMGVEGEDSQLLNLVVSESGRINQIVEEFLDYARIQVVEPQPINIARVAHEVAALARNHPSCSEGRQIEVLLDVCPFVLADEGQLKQVLLNLVLNGLEAVESDGTVTMRRPEAGDSRPRGHGLVEVWIQDDGPGVEPEEIEHIFEPFHTNKRGGTGLGLAVVQRIVESHEGQIAYLPSRDGRSTFRIYLPEGESGS